MKKILKFLTGRLFIFALCIAIQLIVLIMMILFLSQYGMYMYGVFTILSLVTILYIVSKRDNPIYKLAWVIPIALFPILGWFVYLMVGRNNVSKKMYKRIKSVYTETINLAQQDSEVLKELSDNHPIVSKQVAYIRKTTNLSVHTNTMTEFLSPGITFFERLCEELEKAQKFIFMEYFILQEGKMWDTVLEILVRKVKQGVNVKLIYDDLGCIETLPYGYAKKLESYGIEVNQFNVFKPSIDAYMNYRDHRKITVIDGNVGFTGGNNLADEYINFIDKHGYWHDSSIMLKGDGVWNLSVMFLQMWQYYKMTDMDYSMYKPTQHFETDGYVMPFGDSPMDNYLIGETVYMNMISNAKRYVSITTPYLILDNEMITVLCTAAQSGIDVSIITPGNADKWYVHMVTRYNYQTLISAGVKIYEFKGGFIHAKTVVCDDETAVVGTQNFDFRSFYLHFECGVFLYNTSSVIAVRNDHLACLKRSVEITIEDCKKTKPIVRLIRSCLNLFSPLM